MARQEENKKMIAVLMECDENNLITDEKTTITVLIDISKSLAVIADAADSIKTKINNRF